MQVQTVLKELRLESVLYATDFKADATLALPYVISLARTYHSKIYVVHVVDLFPSSTMGLTSAMRAVEAQAVSEAKQAAQELRPAFAQVPNEMLVRKGNVWKEISRIVDEKNIDLIVVGTHGREGIRKMVLGSVAEQIFRRAPCPVLTIGPRIHGEPDRFSQLHSILVPVDFSPESSAAVSYSAALAQIHQARVYLLHVTRDEEAIGASLKEGLRNLIPPEVHLSVAPKVFVEQGLPSEKILDLAAELAVDLIVLGVKRPLIFEGAFTHQNMATASKVVSAAECPVITVRPPS
jgi:nucleotide-binding universal stress UspA family protein